jgi:hypothetical protein
MAPTNVLAAWRAYEKNKAIASGAKKPPVKKPGSKEEIARLQQETDDQRAELKKVKATLVIMKSSASTMAAKVWEEAAIVVHIGGTHSACDGRSRSIPKSASIGLQADPRGSASNPWQARGKAEPRYAGSSQADQRTGSP